MAAISISISRGKSGFTISDFTYGTSAPGSGDCEFRFNNQDTNSHNFTREELWIMLEQIGRIILSGQGLQYPAGTPLIAGPFGPPQ